MEESLQEMTSHEAHQLPSTILLPPQSASKLGKKTLILDLDETLVHSCFEPIEQPHYQIEVDLPD